MQVSDLVFEVRNSSLARVGMLTPDDGLTTFKATLRLNNTGTWEITIPENRPLADVLRQPGSGIIVTGPNGVIISGPMTAATKTNESGSPIGSWLFRGADDSIVLGERLAYPTPASADVTLQTQAYDVVTSVKASTAMIGYVTRNIGSSAPTARKIAAVTTVADPAVGSNISYAARFDMLGKVLSDIANVDGLAFDMYQSGSNILFNVWAPTDRSKTVRLDVANNTLLKSTYGYGYGVSRAIVAGQGVGTARTFTEVSTTDSLLTESSFGRRVERFVDQRDESDSAKLVVSGKSTLADAGGLISSVDVIPSSDSTMRPLVDFNLGDKVSVVIASQEVAAVITQMALSVTDQGVYVGVTVGNPVGVDFEAITAKRQTDATAGVADLRVIESVIPAGAIVGSQIAAGTITSTNIADGAVNTAELADSAVTSAKIADGTIATADLADGSVTMAKSANNGLVPTGVVMAWTTATAPSGWVICDGTAVSRTTYANLYAVIGTTYGVGDGSTTFNLPNLKGRVPVGVGLATANGATTHTLAQSAGEETHTLTTAEIPSHQHQVNDQAYHDTSSTTNTFFTTGAQRWMNTKAFNAGFPTLYTYATGGGGAHNNMQPYLGLNYIIKT